MVSAYKPFDGGSVLIGNDVVCKIIGIGNICVNMFDGHVQTLLNVHHALDLRKNLLSLGDLEAQRCKFSGADGGIEVTKGYMIIFK